MTDDGCELYGHELAQTTSEHFEIAEGSVYPVLRRLTRQDFFMTRLVPSASGPARKYYRLTDLGWGRARQLADDMVRSQVCRRHTLK